MVPSLSQHWLQPCYAAFFSPSRPSATLPLTALLVNSALAALASLSALPIGVATDFTGDTPGVELESSLSAYTFRLLYAVGLKIGPGSSLGTAGKSVGILACASRLSDATASSTASLVALCRASAWLSWSPSTFNSEKGVCICFVRTLYMATRNRRRSISALLMEWKIWFDFGGWYGLLGICCEEGS